MSQLVQCISLWRVVSSYSALPLSKWGLLHKESYWVEVGFPLCFQETQGMDWGSQQVRASNACGGVQNSPPLLFIRWAYAKWTYFVHHWQGGHKHINFFVYIRDVWFWNWSLNYILSHLQHFPHTRSHRATVGGNLLLIRRQETWSTLACLQPHTSSVSLKTVLSFKFPSYQFFLSHVYRKIFHFYCDFFLHSTHIVSTTFYNLLLCKMYIG